MAATIQSPDTTTTTHITFTPRTDMAQICSDQADRAGSQTHTHTPVTHTCGPNDSHKQHHHPVGRRPLLHSGLAQSSAAMF
jgi:hypothetical protein